jgi:ubiquinone/menaquinone biosynthesis C-methylase UbiE
LVLSESETFSRLSNNDVRGTIVMSFYEDRVLPHLIQMSMRQENLATYRHRLLSRAQGRVLEVGVGSGLNFRHYGGSVECIIGLDPSPKLLSMAEEAANGVPVRVELLRGTAEAIPLRDESVDTLVTTWTLCSIPDVAHALSEMRRVLKARGRLLFVEHGRSPDPKVCRWQDRLTPLWKRIGGGCHLNRATNRLIEGAGFRIEYMDTGYMKGPKPMTFMYEGVALRN